LFADGQFATADRKARFSVTRTISAESAEPAKKNSPAPSALIVVRVSTRRGKQFNAMIQRDVDPLTGAARDAVFICADDLARLQLRDGDRMCLQSATGSYVGCAQVAPITPGNVEVHWPEGNVLLSASAIDPDSFEPDYNATVTITPA